MHVKLSVKKLVYAKRVVVNNSLNVNFLAFSKKSRVIAAFLFSGVAFCYYAVCWLLR
jgi:hypothetical protein